MSTIAGYVPELFGLPLSVAEAQVSATVCGVEFTTYLRDGNPVVSLLPDVAKPCIPEVNTHTKK